MIYYSLTDFCLFGSIMTENHKWGEVFLRCTVRTLSTIVIQQKAYLHKGPLFPFSSCFAQSDDRVLIRKCRLLNPLFSPSYSVALHLAGPHFTVFCIETSGISGISIRTGQLFLCGYNTAGSSLIASWLS